MDNSVIAVQIADGSFVPVLDTATQKRRRLVVTTVRDNQTDVRIGLYRGSDESMLDAEYIGSLVIGDIQPSPAQQADITVLTGVDETGNLNVTASDSQSGQYESLSVSLEELASAGEASLGDFEVATTDEGDFEDLSLDDLSLDELATDESEPEEPVTDEPAEITEAIGDDEGEDVLLEDLELDIEEDEPTADATTDELSLEDLSLDDSEDLALEEASDDELSLDELSFDDAEELTLEDGTETVSESSDDELSLGDLSFDDAEELTLEDGTETVSETSDDELSLDDLSFDDAEELTLEDGTETVGEASDDELSLDDLSLEETSEDELEESSTDSLDDLSLDDISFEDEPESEDALASFSDDSVALDESLSLDESESLDDTPFAEESLSEGMEQADLGDEDFTFDESEEDEPLFFADEAGSDAAPDDELASLGASQSALDDTLSPEEFDQLDSRPHDEIDHAEDVEDQPLAPRKSNAVIYAGYIILALAAVGVLTYLVFRLLEGPPAPPLRASYVPGLAVFGFLRVKKKRNHRSR